MSDIDNTPRTYSGALLAAIAVALLGALGGLIWSATINSRLSTQQVELTDAKQQNVKLAAELRETNARLKVATEELGQSLGLTQKQMDARAQEIIRREAKVPSVSFTVPDSATVWPSFRPDLIWACVSVSVPTVTSVFFKVLSDCTT